MFASQTEGELKVTQVLKEKFPRATAIKVTDISGEAFSHRCHGALLGGRGVEFLAGERLKSKGWEEGTCRSDFSVCVALGQMETGT